MQNNYINLIKAFKELDIEDKKEEILKKIYGNKKSYSLISFIGKVTLAILTLLYSVFILKFKNIGVVVILMYLWYLKIKEDKKINRLIKLYDCIEKNFD